MSGEGESSVIREGKYKISPGNRQSTAWIPHKDEPLNKLMQPRVFQNTASPMITVCPLCNRLDAPLTESYGEEYQNIWSRDQGGVFYHYTCLNIMAEQQAKQQQR